MSAEEDSNWYELVFLTKDADRWVSEEPTGKFRCKFLLLQKNVYSQVFIFKNDFNILV